MPKTSERQKSELMQQHYTRADKTMLIVVSLMFVYSLALSFMHDTLALAIVVGGATTALAFILYKYNPGKRTTRIYMGLALMMLTALQVHQAHGMIEMHFGFFAFLALLLYYHDWLTVVVSAAFVAVHHLGFFYLQQQGTGVFILDSADRSWLIIFLHAGYLIAETIVLIIMSRDLHKKEQSGNDVQDTVKAITKGDSINLSERCNSEGIVGESFNRFMQMIHTLIENLNTNGNTLNHASTELTQLMTESTTEMQQQKQETEKIASAISEMTGAIQSIAQSAEQAADSAQQAQELVVEGSNVSKETQNGMQQLGSQINDAAQAIHTLASESENIGSVLDVIRGIAEQTNLLALNAAIEAARAGEQGRGFAVVADEVRSLASRTQQSTEEINNMINKLQEGSKNTVTAMETSQTLMETCVSNTQKTSETMNSVVTSITNIMDMNNLIASATTEQESVMQSVSENTQIMQDISESNHQRIEGVSTASTSVDTIAHDIHDAIRQFKV